MSSIFLPTTLEIRDVFAEEIYELGGSVLDRFVKGAYLYLRATLPRTADVGARDSVQHGIAMRTRGTNLHVHPYVFRKVCSNGAISAQAKDSFVIGRVDFSAANDRIEAVYEGIRAAVSACVDGDSFAKAVGQMRLAKESPGDIDLLLSMMAEFVNVDDQTKESLLNQVSRRYEAEEDRSLFGLMNAVTSVARDTPNPETKWELETLGGGVPALACGTPKPSDTQQQTLQLQTCSRGLGFQPVSQIETKIDLSS